VTHHIVARLADALEAAAAAGRQLGHAVRLPPEFLHGEAATVGRQAARELLEGPPGLTIWGGETRVCLPDQPGRGGRNQHLALAAATILEGSADAWLLAAGSDGSDGPGEDAGALVDGGTLARGREWGLDPQRALREADSGTFLDAAGDLLHTGPTGTNVMDLLIGLRS
jgi:glycerate 2-kinase